MSQKTYRAAAIGHTGAGNYGHGLHLPFQELDNIEFVAIADPDEAGRGEEMEKTGVERGYADYREMLDKEDLDIVSMGPRWTTDHLEMLLGCINAGCHVYSEKPMTATLAEGDQIVEAGKSGREKSRCGASSGLSTVNSRGQEDAARRNDRNSSSDSRTRQAGSARRW